jgi:hypothetical protein
MWELFDTGFRASFHVLGVMYKNILKWCKDENYSFKHWEQDSQTSNFIIYVLDEAGNEKEFVFTKEFAIDKFYNKKI